MRLLATLALALCTLFFFASTARAETLEAPVGGRPVELGGGRVACATSAGDWAATPDALSVRPPMSEGSIGHAVDLRVAPNAAACATSTTTMTLVTTGRWPTIDPASPVLAVDEGRLDVRGRGLRGTSVVWRRDGKGGQDVCELPQLDGAVERCSFSVGRALSADPGAQSLTWLPSGARADADVTTFDATGHRVTPAELALRPAKIVLRSLVQGDATLDLAAGGASRLSLTHPEAVASAECGAASCEIAGGAVVVRSVQNVTGSLSLRLRLVPHVVFARADKEDAAPVFSISIVPCAMSIASGEVLRGLDDVRAVIRVDPRCAGDAGSLRFTAGGRTADVISLVDDKSGAFVVVRLGRVEGDEVTVTAARAGDSSIVGVARARTRASPQPRAVVALAEGGTIDFIPNNREATVRFADPGASAELVLLPLEDVYDVARSSSGTTVRGLRSASGFVALRFGYRVGALPGPLGTVDLAIIVDPLERPIHEANVPALLGASAFAANPLVELDCGDGKGHTLVVPPGKTTHIPFGARDSCRVVFHRARLAAEEGAQLLHLDIDVLRVDGTPRPEAHVSQPIVLRTGKEDRYAWIRGITGSFDHVTVRLSHSGDESHYATGADIHDGAPSVQWSVVSATGHARIYATTAIPTGLYRVSDHDHSGILTLNFGVIARLTWLDEEGHEGFLGLEGGVMGMGLANDISSTGHSLTQVATVSGLGLSVPIANRSLATETSINLHAWFEYEVSRDLGNEPGSPLGFVFGPSISIGNIGTNL